MASAKHSRRLEGWQARWRASHGDAALPANWKQQARGHKAAEHTSRPRYKEAQLRKEARARHKDAEKAAPPPKRGSKAPATGLLGGLTGPQRKAVRAFGWRQLARAERTDAAVADEEAWMEDLISWATRAGYDMFEAVRAFQRALAKQYRAERRAGLPYPKKLKGGTGILEHWMARYGGAPVELFFYH